MYVNTRPSVNAKIVFLGFLGQKTAKTGQKQAENHKNLGTMKPKLVSMETILGSVWE